MIDQKIEELLPKTGWSMYKLVSMASKRALELADGKKNFIGAPASAKVTTVALMEIAAGKVVEKKFANLLAKQEEPEAAEKTDA